MTTYNEWTCIEVAKTMQGRYKKIDAAKGTRPSLRLGINHYREKKITSREAGRCGTLRGGKGRVANQPRIRQNRALATDQTQCHSLLRGAQDRHYTSFSTTTPSCRAGPLRGWARRRWKDLHLHHSPQYVNSNWPVSIPSILARSTGHRSPRARSRDAQLRQARL